ncbi:hypothetical protein Lal_00008416 [Lupinus albus]|nr:hypothetical protein Lal_00008416 [Lupinus albus]
MSVRLPRGDVAADEGRVGGHDPAVDLDAEVHPVAHQVAVVVGRVGGVAVTGVALVVAAAGAEVADAAGVAAGALAVQALGEEVVELGLLHPAVHVAEGGQAGAGKAVAEVEPAFVVHGQHLQAGATGQRLLLPLVDVGDELVEVGEADVAVLQRRLQVAPAEGLHVGEDLHQFLTREVVVAEVARGDRGETDLGETHFVEQVVPDGFDVGDAPGQGHPRAHRAAAVARQQHVGLAPHHVVGALPAHGDAVAVVHRLRPVDADGEAEAMGVEPVDDLLGEQRGVGGHDELHRLADLRETPLAVAHHVLDQRAVGERFAAEEHHAVAGLVGGLAQQHLHRGLGGLDGHLAAGRGLVEVLLVAVGAAEVAAGVDVQYHGVQCGALDPLDADFRRQWRAVADQLQRDQLAQGLAHLLPGEAPGQALHQVLGRAALLAQRVDDAAGDGVRGEQRTAGDVEQHAVRVHLHFMQVALDQIQDCAHGDLRGICPIVDALGDHLQVAGVIGHHPALGVGAGGTGDEHAVLLHLPGELHVLVLLGACVEGRDRPAGRQVADAVRLAGCIPAPGLGLETALHLGRGAAVLAHPGDGERGHHLHLGDLAVDRQGHALELAQRHITHTRRSIGGSLDPHAHLLRRRLQHLDHLQAGAQLRGAFQAAAHQGQLRFATGLDRGRLHGQQLGAACLGGAEVEAALIVLGLEHAALHLAVQGGEDLAHGGVADLHITAPFIAVVEDGRAAARKGRAIGVGALHLQGEAVAGIGRHRHHAAHIALGEHVAAEAPLPRQRIRPGSRLLPVGPGLVLQREALGELGHHLLEGDIQPVAVAGLGLVLQRRPLAKVEVDQVLPLPGRAALQGHPCAGVAAAAHLGQLLVELLHRVEASLHGVAHALGLAGGQALLVRQVLDQGAAVVVADGEAMHHLHARNAHQPAFGRLALMADAAVAVAALGNVAAHALALEQGRALLHCLGLGAQQGCRSQQQAARTPPESNRLQGRTSTVLFLWFAPVSPAAETAAPTGPRGPGGGTVQRLSHPVSNCNSGGRRRCGPLSINPFPFNYLTAFRGLGTGVARAVAMPINRGPAHAFRTARTAPDPRLPRPPAEDADRRWLAGRRQRRHPGLPQPRHGRCAGQRALRRRRGCRPRRTCRTPGLRRLALEPHAPARTAEPAVAPGRPDGTRRPATGRAGMPEQRQERRRRPGDGCATGHRLPALHGRLGHQDRRHHGRSVAAADARRPLPRLHPPRGGGRGGRHRRLELSPAAGLLEARPGAGHRLHPGAQARRRNPAHRPQAGRVGAGGGLPGGGVQRGDRHRPQRRRRPHPPPGRGQADLHRLHRGGQADRQGGDGQHDPRDPGTGRQIPHPRPARCQPAGGRRRRRHGHLLQPGAGVLRRLAPLRAPQTLRQRGRRHRRHRQRHEARQRPRPQRADGPADLRQATGPRHRLHRPRPRTRRHRRLRRRRLRPGLLRQTHRHRRRGPEASPGAGRNLRPRARRHALRRPRPSRAPGQRQPLRPGRQHLVQRPFRRAPHDPAHQIRLRLGQLPQRPRPGAAVRGLQDVGGRPRDGRGCDRALHGGEVGVDQGVRGKARPAWAGFQSQSSHMKLSSVGHKRP